jgi:predicted membrane protein
MKPSKEYLQIKRVGNLIRLSLLMIIAPVLYIGLWIFILGDESLTYFEQVQRLMSFFPESFRNPFGITLIFFGMSFISAASGFYAYLNSNSKTQRRFSLALTVATGLITLWFGFTLL